MPGRNQQGDYRYAYQGQEKDPETGWEAFELRMYDGRVGRWMTTDPYSQYHSPYLAMGNNPINLIDPDGGKAFWKDDGFGNLTAEANDNAYTLAEHLGIDVKDAKVTLENQGFTLDAGGAYNIIANESTLYGVTTPTNSFYYTLNSPIGFTLAGTPPIVLGNFSKTPISKSLVKNLRLIPRVTGFKGMNSYTNLERVVYMRYGGSSGSLSKYWGSNLIRTGEVISSVGLGLDVSIILLDFNSYQNSSSYKGLGDAEQFNYQNIGPSWLGGIISNWWNNSGNLYSVPSY